MSSLGFDDLPAAVEQLIQDVHELRSLLQQERQLVQQEWLTLREACELKGISYDAMRKRPRRYWPNRGNHHVVIASGRHAHMYHRSEVAEWLPLTEQDIDKRIDLERRKERHAV